ncbi:hypothetical protein JHK82_042301 [Glycine max]|uniref:Uncharacterized protein n=2 Tax=Glycine subgen. Soja TaxID=1462606 RepID=K7MBB6_SOYBN|nr:hypothetical protein JHK87_042258 [Glycine soja]KAG4956589.1 hypothetical protein JHK85_042969 [Glycine max]KAG5105331.1 hypothetical protein JHK82_042301 [Glycine max]RZB64591.1 hypothetical protein D0Y65_040899 [Glycine soja]
MLGVKNIISIIKEWIIVNRTVTIAFKVSSIANNGDGEVLEARINISNCRILVLAGNWLDGIRAPPFPFDIIKHGQQGSFGPNRRLPKLNTQTSIAAANLCHKRDTMRTTRRHKIVLHGDHVRKLFIVIASLFPQNDDKALSVSVSSIQEGGGLENPTTLRNRVFSLGKSLHASWSV